jgi:SAM-dependent methyltransferase
MAFRQFVKRWVPCLCAYYLVDDWRKARRLRRGQLQTDSGRRHEGLSIDASLAYIERIHREYLEAAEIRRFSGTIAEIGPGDNFGFALLALADGAEAVDAIDRFYSRRDREAQARIYAELCRRRGLSGLFSGPPAEDNVKGLAYRAGEPAESYFRKRPGAYDFILSRAVMEHLYAPLETLDDMARALRPGGRLIHRIDLRDHAMFPGHHPLTFLTVPEGVYRRMVAASGRPNRAILPHYRRWLEASGLPGALKITRLVGVEGEFAPSAWEALPQAARAAALATVERIRPKLARPFRGMSAEDLATAGCVLTARKPAEAQAEAA